MSSNNEKLLNAERRLEIRIRKMLLEANDELRQQLYAYAYDQLFDFIDRNNM